MPVYEYQCKQCGKEFEYQQRMSDPDKTVCENCGGELERLISRTAFALKGGGWYKDLYASAKPDKPAGDAKAEGGSDAKSEAKPEAKSDSSAPASTPAAGASGGSTSGDASGSPSAATATPKPSPPPKPSSTPKPGSGTGSGT